jgi:hypothetical protein
MLCYRWKVSRISLNQGAESANCALLTLLVVAEEEC